MCIMVSNRLYTCDHCKKFTWQIPCEYCGGEQFEAATEDLHTRRADEFLQHGIDLLRERGKQYDQPDGERSMGKTVAAFTAATCQRPRAGC